MSSIAFGSNMKLTRFCPRKVRVKELKKGVNVEGSFLRGGNGIVLSGTEIGGGSGRVGKIAEANSDWLIQENDISVSSPTPKVHSGICA